MRVDRRTDMTKLIAAFIIFFFLQFANTPKPDRNEKYSFGGGGLS